MLFKTQWKCIGVRGKGEIDYENGNTMHNINYYNVNYRWIYNVCNCTFKLFNQNFEKHTT